MQLDPPANLDKVPGRKGRNLAAVGQYVFIFPPSNVLFRHVPLLQEKLQTLTAKEEGMVSPLHRSGSEGKPGGTPCPLPYLHFHPPTPRNRGVYPKSVWLFLGSVGETQEGMGLD